MGLNLFTSAQVNSLINKVKTEHAKIKELSKTQLKQQKPKLELSNLGKVVESAWTNNPTKRCVV